MFRWFLLLLNVFGFSPIVHYFPSVSQLFARSKHRRTSAPLSMLYVEEKNVIFYCCTSAVIADESRKRKLSVCATLLDSFSLNVSVMFRFVFIIGGFAMSTKVFCMELCRYDFFFFLVTGRRMQRFPVNGWPRVKWKRRMYMPSN